MQIFADFVTTAASHLLYVPGFTDQLLSSALDVMHHHDRALSIVPPNLQQESERSVQRESFIK